VVEEDAHLAVVAARVAEGVLDLGLARVLRRREEVVTHGDADAALELDLVVVVDALRPALAAVDREARILLVAVVDDRAADEVRHGLLAGRPELVLGGLGRLEEHVGVAVGVQLAGGLAGGRDVVAALLVDLGDALDCRGPVCLHLQNIDLSHWRRRRGGTRTVRHRRVVEEDAHLAVVAARVAEGVLDLGLARVLRRREEVVTHGDADAALELDLVVVVDALRPALAAVDREARILLVAVVDDRAADEVRHGLLAGRPELVLGGLGRLEEHVGVAVGVQLAGGLAGGRDVVAALLVDLGDALDRVGPFGLDDQDLLLRHGRGPRRPSGVRHRGVVQEDAHLAVGVLTVAESVLDLHLRTVGGVREVVGAHSDGGVTAELDLVVVEYHVGPTLATVDCEACILGVAVLDCRAADKVRHGLVGRGAERVLGGLGRLEEHVGVAVAVQLAGRLARRADVVAAGQVDLGDGLYGVGPVGLSLEHLQLGDDVGRAVKGVEAERAGLRCARRVDQLEAALRHRAHHRLCRSRRFRHRQRRGGLDDVPLAEAQDHAGRRRHGRRRRLPEDSRWPEG